jgi:predicted dehydrogenase
MQKSLLLPASFLAVLAAISLSPAREEAATGTADGETMALVHFVTLDPGHFHAALVQKEMYPGVAPRVDVYAPLGPDLIGHLARVARFNLRAQSPTAWRLEVHTGPDFFERLLRERPGNVVVISGRNRGKIERIRACLDAGLNALVDKPWILEAEDLPKLEAALAIADRRGLVALDIMTERYEVTSQLQRELVADRDTFGNALPGSAEEPAAYMESVHHLKKVVAGAPNIRPTWFFDTDEQGEGLNDIGTHLVDLVQWTLLPEEAIDYREDIEVLAAQRWPTRIPREEFEAVTTEDFPPELGPHIRDGVLEYFCNTLVTYRLRGHYVRLNVIWDWEAPPGAGDSHFAYYRGSRSRLEIRQGQAERHRPELYVVPNSPGDKGGVLSAARARIAALQDRYPGVGVEDAGEEIRITIPDSLRVGHEGHFAQVTQAFLGYMRDRSTLPDWERPNMLAKYYVTTQGTALARRSPPRPAERIAPR